MFSYTEDHFAVRGGGGGTATGGKQCSVNSHSKQTNQAIFHLFSLSLFSCSFVTYLCHIIMHSLKLKEPTKYSHRKLKS